MIFSVKCFNENISTGEAGGGVIVGLPETTGDLYPSSSNLDHIMVNINLLNTIYVFILVKFVTHYTPYKLNDYMIHLLRNTSTASMLRFR